MDSVVCEIIVKTRRADGQRGLCSGRRADGQRGRAEFCDRVVVSNGTQSRGGARRGGHLCRNVEGDMPRVTVERNICVGTSRLSLRAKQQQKNHPHKLFPNLFVEDSPRERSPHPLREGKESRSLPGSGSRGHTTPGAVHTAPILPSRSRIANHVPPGDVHLLPRPGGGRAGPVHLGQAVSMR